MDAGAGLERSVRPPLRCSRWGRRGQPRATRRGTGDPHRVGVHGDPARPNCVRGAAGTGFVDWELVHVGDPARELHRAEDQLLPETATNASELRDALTDEPEATVAKRVGSEMQRRLDAIR
ncbi:phosphotransferase [Natronococcus occultus]|uniref:phosphotransferase n=1 Tax=Natronococcus occultus TaxID=29288 RepID=UPI000677CE9B|nr:phosphotransferase [Natronococcus occultus]